MILSDREIKKYLKEGKLKIEPLNIDEQIMPVGIDLRLGNEFRVFKMGSKSHIDPRDNIEDSTELIKIKSGDTFIIHPGELVLGVTKEYIELPDDVAARIDGRSSLGRLGIIVHSTAGHVDPKFRGKLTLEISNIGRLPVSLIPNMKFCSLIFEKISSPVEKGYKGKYLDQITPTVSKISEEFKKKGS